MPPSDSGMEHFESVLTPNGASPSQRSHRLNTTRGLLDVGSKSSSESSRITTSQMEITPNPQQPRQEVKQDQIFVINRFPGGVVS